ncbi:MAG TPA: hypothetical protein VGI70_01740 [Polyangiales bacterium]
MADRVSSRSLLSLLVCWLVGCGHADEWSGPLPAPDGAAFVREVYPLLLRDCAFSTCHGAADRFLQLYGPGRARLDPIATKPDDPMTLPEVLHSYDRARSMLATANRIDDSLLLSKPLEPSAGGQGHEGVDDFGRNPFASSLDPSYVAIAQWALSSGPPPSAADVAAANQALEMTP